MYIIVGLGNPGKKFEHTRHNAGFEVLDFFAKQNEFPEFELSKKYESLISGKDDIILVKPQTFMNESGRAVKEILKNKNEPTLVVVHDDIDMDLGKVKMVRDSGSGGHKGVESIIQALETKDFARFKIGVKTDERLAEEVVLEKFSPEQLETLQSVFPQISQELEKFMNGNN